MEKIQREDSKDLYEWLRLNGHNYSILHSAGVGGQNFKVAFSHKDCKYYIAPEVEIAEARFKAIMPYLRWNFDQIEEITEEREVEVEAVTKSGNPTTKKVKEQVGTGKYRNAFPPTTQNIIRKRNELKAEMMSNKSDAGPSDFNSINIKTVPRLVDHERIEAIKAKQGYADIERIARRIESTVD